MPFKGKPDKLTDNELLNRIGKNDEASFNELYDRYFRLVYRFLLKYLKSAELSEDLTQSVFVKFWEQRQQAREIRNFGAFIFTIAKRQALDFLKRAAIEETAMALILNNYQPAVATPEDNYQFNEYMAFVEKVILTLPEQTQVVFTLCRRQHQSYEEAAAVLGVSRNTVKKHMVRSMKVLKQAVEARFGLHSLVLLALLIPRP